MNFKKYPKELRIMIKHNIVFEADKTKQQTVCVIGNGDVCCGFKTLDKSLNFYKIKKGTFKSGKVDFKEFDKVVKDKKPDLILKITNIKTLNVIQKCLDILYGVLLQKSLSKSLKDIN